MGKLSTCTLNLYLNFNSHFVPNITMGMFSELQGRHRRRHIDSAVQGAPILSCVHKGVPGIFMDCHMMVAQPEKVPHVPLRLALLFMSA